LGGGEKDSLFPHAKLGEEKEGTITSLISEGEEKVPTLCEGKKLIDHLSLAGNKELKERGRFDNPLSCSSRRKRRPLFSWEKKKRLIAIPWRREAEKEKGKGEVGVILKHLSHFFREREGNKR